jgi:predicted transcriptional regulator
MKRTTIMLPEELRLRAQQLARASNQSLADLIRKSLEKTLAEKRHLAKDSFFADKVTWKGSAPKDLSANVDKYLYDEDQP